MQLTLLIPELIWPEPEDTHTLNDLSCPALSTLLARGHCSRAPQQAFETLLSDFFGHHGIASLAPLRLLGESTTELEANVGHWVCCDPVHLRLHQEHLILADSTSVDLALEEAQILAAGLNEHLSDSGRFHVATADRWYLQLAGSDQTCLADVPPLSSVAGRRIERILPETPEAKSLRQLLNEVQMLLHAHPINQQRENTERMTINSLWLWGAGSLPERIESRFDGVCSSNPLARGLAAAAGIPTHPTPNSARSLLEHAARGSRQLVVLEDLHQPVLYENAEAYRDALNDLEQRWFNPLRSALSFGKIKQLHIATSTAYGSLAWTLQRGDLWKLWRVPQPLAALAKELAKNTP